MERDKTSARAEWQAHWPLVSASTLGIGLGVIHLYSMGVFITPLSQEFGWRRVEISSALSIVTVFSVVSAYFVGLLVDRLGPRRIAIPGAVAYCLSFAALATLSGALWHWWLCWILIAVTVQFVKPTVWAAAVTSRFTASRGLAIAVMMTGTGIASSVNPLVANALLEAFDWRAAYVGLAALWAVVTIPLCVRTFYGATDAQRGPKGAVADPRTLTGMTLRRALLGRQFWTLAISVVASTAIIMGTMVHFIPAAIDGGLDSTSAAAVAGLIGISSITGRLVTGLVIDRFSGRIVGAVAFALPMIACLLLLMPGASTVHFAIAACVIGFALGADADVGAYLVSRYFGLRHFGALYGALIGLLGLATGGGPLLAGLAFDWTQSYQIYFQAGIPVCAVASLLLLTIGPYPEPDLPSEHA